MSNCIFQIFVILCQRLLNQKISDGRLLHLRHIIRKPVSRAVRPFETKIVSSVFEALRKLGFMYTATSNYIF